MFVSYLHTQGPGWLGLKASHERIKNNETFTFIENIEDPNLFQLDPDPIFSCLFNKYYENTFKIFKSMVTVTIFCENSVSYIMLKLKVQVF